MATQSKSGDSLGDRMKSFENAFKHKFPSETKLPVIIRIDGKAFHTYTLGCEKPFDAILIQLMDETAIKLCESIQGSVMAYVQSDEISILVYPWVNENSQPWFDNEINKMVSVSAGIASSWFTSISHRLFGSTKPAVFDSRAFTLPMHEINNYFIWRQQDWERNSVQLLGRTKFSQKELYLKNCKTIQEMLMETHGVDWNNLLNHLKWGRVIRKETYPGPENSQRHRWIVDPNIPKFTQDKEFIIKMMPVSSLATLVVSDE